ncbi:MAG: outer membrane protein assembly factor BamD [Rhizomicrobium sp.]
MAPRLFLIARSWRPVLVALAAGLVLTGCDTLNGLTGRGRDEDKPPEYVERPIDQIYGDAWKKIRGSDWLGAAKQFDEVERQHPYSIWARRAMLMSAFCYYRANHYTEAIAAADQYIQLHPGSKEVAYAFYLKAVSLYEQIVDVGRDQSNTEDALTALQDVVQRFPRHRICPRRDAEDRPDAGSPCRQGDGSRALLSARRRLYRRHQPLPHRGRAVPEDLPDRRGAGTADRGLLCAGSLQRGQIGGGGAGCQLSGQSLV